MHVQSVQKYCFSLSNMQICGGFVAVIVIPSLAPREEHIAFAYQTWKPQFLSVVQFPFDNCHSPFSPTTFFEIGVYSYNLFRRGGLLNRFHPYTAFPLTRPCAPGKVLSLWDKIQWLWYVSDSKSSAFTNLLFRLGKLVQSYFTLIHIVSQESLLDLKEKARRRQ